MTLSNDLRWRAVYAYYEQSLSMAAIAERLYVGERSVRRWIERFRNTGGVSPSRQRRLPKMTASLFASMG